MKSLVIVALFCCFAAVFAAPAEKVRWCVKSDQEYQKCKKLEAKAPVFSCVQAINTMDCITAIAAGTADAITLDGGDVYTAGLHPHNLYPIMAEDYGSDSSSCYYAVAVVKKGDTFGLRDLQNKKSCHTGVGKSAGWNIPVGTLVSQDILKWNGVEDSPIEEAVSNFFQASCAPGAKSAYPKLCQLCKNDCSRSHSEPYYDYAGAFKCLEDGAGDVAFVKHLTVPDSVKADYELLCLDNSRAPIDSYKTCNLAKVPAHAVVSRKDPVMTERIWNSLEAAQTLSGFKLFSSDDYPSAKNLMFKDSTVKLVRLSTVTDSFLYLGAKYISIVRALNKENNVAAASSAVKWCAVGGPEKDKCDLWSTASFVDHDVLECQTATTVKDCLKKILRGEADAIAVDGGEVFTAGKCGLVPAMVEQYDQSRCDSPGAVSSSYYAVAVVKKGMGLTWDKLKGKKSCHTGLGRTAGWNIPMGLIHKETNDCDFTKFFSSGCAPGSEPSSPFCTQCAGSNADVGDPFKCKASSEERYYGYAGAFRCLVEGGGDVAFIKHTIVSENSDGRGPEWAKNVKAEDYELICPGKGPVPVTEYASCNLAAVPAHAVVTRPDVRNKVVEFLQQQQAKNDNSFNMFQSGQNLLFKDSTKCLQEVRAGQTYQQFLGAGYMTAMTSLRQCTDSASDLEKACSFLSCQQTN